MCVSVLSLVFCVVHLGEFGVVIILKAIKKLIHGETNQFIRDGCSWIRGGGLFVDLLRFKMIVRDW